VTVQNLFRDHLGAISGVVHAAGQPSHDWAARAPFVDFSVNANGTLILLEMTRRYSPDAAFVFLSTNKVYGDTSNRLPLTEHETRWELDPAHTFAGYGIDETMSIDDSLHSLFGVSKLAADLLVQEYGRYFGLKTACFRCGCLTGPHHAGVELHGFLSYLMKCAVSGHPYTVFGYKGKQVRDNIHSRDLAEAIWRFVEKPRTARIYNLGGGRFNSCSMLEAIAACERITNHPMNWSYKDNNRIGDHIWWISDVRRFRTHYPEWHLRYDLKTILCELHEAVHAETRG
jgi:CDP-paratose 2-epimerase